MANLLIRIWFTGVIIPGLIVLLLALEGVPAKEEKLGALNLRTSNFRGDLIPLMS